MATARNSGTSGGRLIRELPWLLAAGIVSFLLVAYATTWGAGISPDSVRYVGAARGILAGDGVSVLAGDGTPVPLTKWPPAFPLLLAIPGPWGVDPLEAARWENALFFGGNVMLTVLAAWRASGGSILAAATAAALMLVSVDQLYVHSMAWTEPSFIFFSLVSLLAVATYISGGNNRALWVGAVAGALALLDRYAGASVVLTLAGAIALWGPGRARLRLVNGAILAAVAAAPLTVWVLHNQAAAGNATSRALAANALLPSQIPLALDAASGWVVPLSVPFEFRTVALFALAALCCALLWRAGREHATSPAAGVLVRVAALFAAVYLAVMAVSITLSDPPPIPVDFRYLAPLYPIGVVLAVAAVLSSWRAGARPSFARRAGAVALAVLVVVGAARVLPWLSERHVDGLGYASQVWRRSEVIGLVRTLPAGAQLYSNASDAIYALTGRPGYPLPPVSSYETGQPNAGFLDQIEMVRSGLEGTDGYIVYCRAASRRTNIPGEEMLVELLSLKKTAEANDGAIYRLGP